MVERTLAVLRNTLREALRDRVWIGAQLAALGGSLAIVVVARLSLNEERRILWDLGLAMLSLLAVFITLFLSSALLHRELERKTLFVVLPKPIRRAEFLLGKYLGVVCTVSLLVATAGSSHWLVTRWLGGIVLPAVPMVAALILVCAEAALVAAVATAFGSFSRPLLTSLLTVGVWLIGRSAEAMWSMRSRALAPAMRSLLRGLAHVVPNLQLFTPARHWLFEANQATLSGYVVECVGYAGIYAAVLLGLAAWAFSRRDLIA